MERNGTAFTRPEARFTYEDLLLFPNDGKRHEIIDGDHDVTGSPNLRHQVLVGRLYLAIANFLRSQPQLGRVFVSPLDVVFSEFDVVEPDVLFVAADQLDIPDQAERQRAASARH